MSNGERESGRRATTGTRWWAWAASVLVCFALLWLLRPGLLFGNLTRWVVWVFQAIYLWATITEPSRWPRESDWREPLALLLICGAVDLALALDPRLFAFGIPAVLLSSSDPTLASIAGMVVLIADAAFFTMLVPAAAGKAAGALLARFADREQ